MVFPYKFPDFEKKTAQHLTGNSLCVVFYSINSVHGMLVCCLSEL